MFLNVEQLEKQLDKEDFQEIGSMAAFNVLETQTESKEQDTRSRSGNDAHDDGVDIRPIYDEEPMTEVQTTAEIDVFAIGQQHTEQPEFNNEGEVIQNAEECHDTISSTNMPKFSSNDMVHNHYLEEAKKRTHERSRNSKPSLLPSARSQSIEVNSRATVPSNKTPKRNKLVEQISVPNEQERHIPIGHRFLIKKISVVQKKTMTPRSCLRWKPTGKIFKTVGLRWVPTGRILTSSTTKVDNESLNGSDADITNQYECEQTLDVSA
nr:hypothetical protein [Tanacetum cinerariifolium]